MIIIGGGPAGLTAGYELARRGYDVHIVEKGDKVGGIARTETYKGFRFDIGGHRFYTKIEQVDRLWDEILGDDFIVVPRLSRIFYDGKLYHYPLEWRNALWNLGLIESLLVLLSFVRAHLFPIRPEETFEHWVVNRFGRRLFEKFFKTYTEKVWGIPTHVLRADWAAQRIRGLSMVGAIKNALFGQQGDVKSLINEFKYPVLGPGMMWERFAEAVERCGGTVELNTEAVRLKHNQDSITGVVVRQNGIERELAADHVISTAALDDLVRSISPPPPQKVMQAASALKYRDFLIVVLILRTAETFADNWIYVHSPEVRVGRIQNFRNWSEAMVPDPSMTSLGMEYFCNEDDALWRMPDNELIQYAAGELEQIGLGRSGAVIDGVVLRQRKAYPVYDADYRQHVETIRRYLDTTANLQTIGRNGMHRYNNQDNSMLVAMLAVENLEGASHDLWDVNTDRSYYEEVVLNQD